MYRDKIRIFEEIIMEIKSNIQRDMITNQKGDFYILNFPILKPFLCWELIFTRLFELLVPKVVTNCFIEYKYAYRPF